MEGFREINIQTKPRKSQALTWGLGSNTLLLIFSANLSKVYLKFLQLMYAISTLLVLVAKLVEYPRLLIISPRSLNNF